MKLSAMTYSFSLHDDGRDARLYPGKIAQLGLKGINWVFGYGLDPSEIRDISLKEGLEISSFTCVSKSFIQRESEQEYLAEAESLIKYAAAIGAPSMMMVPMPLCGIENRDEARGMWINYLRKILPYAIENNVILTIETLCGSKSPVVTGADMFEVLENVPGLMATFDVGNTLTAEDPLKALDLIYDKVVFVHLKDWVYTDDRDVFCCSDGLSGRLYAPIPPGEGLVDIHGLLKKLHGYGYDGWLDIEYTGNLPTQEAVGRSVAIMQEKYSDFLD